MSSSLLISFGIIWYYSQKRCFVSIVTILVAFINRIGLITLVFSTVTIKSNISTLPQLNHHHHHHGYDVTLIDDDDQEDDEDDDGGDYDDDQEDDDDEDDNGDDDDDVHALRSLQKGSKQDTSQSRPPPT